MKGLLGRSAACAAAESAAAALAKGTQGVLASKFPISILTRTQGQHRCQKIRKILNNYVPISDFPTRHLNMRKRQKSQKFGKNKNRNFVENAI